MKAFLMATAMTILAAGISEFSTRSLTAFTGYLAADLNETTNGTITESKVIRVGGRSNLAHDIRYSYTVGNRVYSSTHVNFDLRTSNASKLVKSYPVGKKVAVYYDSSNPRHAVLEKGALGAEVLVQVCLIVSAFIISFVASLLAWPRGKKLKK